MDGGFERQTEGYGKDCANCPTCRAYILICREQVKGSLDMIKIAQALAKWMAKPAPGITPDKPGAELNTKSFIAVSKTLEWIQNASIGERLKRAVEVSLSDKELNALVDMYDRVYGHNEVRASVDATPATNRSGRSQ